MGVKLLEIKNRSYYFWNDTVFLDKFNSTLLKLDKKEAPMGITIYYIGYITKKAVYSINSVNPLHLIIKSIEVYFEEKDNGDRYLNISNVDQNSEVINKFNELWKFFKEWILKLNGSIEGYDKTYRKN